MTGCDKLNGFLAQAPTLQRNNNSNAPVDITMMREDVRVRNTINKSQAGITSCRMNHWDKRITNTVKTLVKPDHNNLSNLSQSP